MARPALSLLALSLAAAPLAAQKAPFAAAAIESLRAQEGRRVAAAEGTNEFEVPADAVTASGSGLDPDISPEYAGLQVARVAAAHGLDTEAVASLVDRHTSSGLLAFLGQPSVNVTSLNLAVAGAAQASQPAQSE